jgi:hypothetical protein
MEMGKALEECQGDRGWKRDQKSPPDATASEQESPEFHLRNNQQTQTHRNAATTQTPEKGRESKIKRIQNPTLRRSSPQSYRELAIFSSPPRQTSARPNRPNKTLHSPAPSSLRGRSTHPSAPRKEPAPRRLQKTSRE